MKQRIIELEKRYQAVVNSQKWILRYVQESQLNVVSALGAVYEKLGAHPEATEINQAWKEWRDQHFQKFIEERNRSLNLD